MTFHYYGINLARGTILVYRTVRGKEEFFKIPQTRYKEFPGCFSVL